jgi:hypothetical protein
VTDLRHMPAEVFLDEQMSPEQQDVITDALAALGVSVRVRIVPRRRSASDLQWLVLAALPVQAFLSAIGTDIANNAYEHFQDAVRSVLRRKHPDQPPATRPLVLQDTTSGLQIILDHNLPADGYRQLLTLDLSPFRIGPLHYDLTQHRWRSELDEAATVERPPDSQPDLPAPA